MFIVYDLSLHAPRGQESLSDLFSNLSQAPRAVLSTQEALSKYLLNE